MGGLWSLVEDPWTLWPLLAVFLIGCGLRVLEFSRPVRYDEAFTYLVFARLPLAQALSHYSAPNNHLFHTLLVWLSTHLLGNTLTALRLPALAGGILMMPAAFALATELYGRRAGLVATALVACSPAFIDYSVNGRGYTWQTTLLLLMAWFAGRIAGERGKLGDWLGLVCAAVLAVYTIPTSVLPCAGIILWLCLTAWQRGGAGGLLSFAKRMLPAALAILVLVTALYLPVMISSGPRWLFGNRFIAPMGRVVLLASIRGFVRETWTRWNSGWPRFAPFLVGAGFLFALLLHRKIARHALPLAPALFLACGLYVSLRTTLGYSRIWLYLWAFVMVTAGAAIAFALSRRSCVAAFAVTFTLLAGLAAHRQEVYLWSIETGNVPELARAAEWMNRNLDARDQVVASMLCEPGLRYLLLQKFPRLEPQLDSVPSPRRIVAAISKQPKHDPGRPTNGREWQLREAAPDEVMFTRNDRAQYSEPRIVQELIGVTLWESWRISPQQNRNAPTLQPK